jgi:hypothetical protein
VSVGGQFPKTNRQPYIISKELKKEGLCGVVLCGGFFLLARDSWAFSSELVWFAPLFGEGKQS